MYNVHVHTCTVNNNHQIILLLYCVPYYCLIVQNGIHDGLRWKERKKERQAPEANE